MNHRRRISRSVLLSLLLVLLLAAGQAVCADTRFSEDTEAIEQAAQSVLKLCIYDEDRNMIATGSGFILFDNRTLITNYHVIEDAAYVEAESDDGYEYTVSKLMTADKKKDLAILHLKTPTVMQPLTIETDMSVIKRGSTCVAIGSPKGITNTVSIGNVSAVYTEDGVSYVQFTAPVSHGSSGGALFSDSGRVIGITSAIYDDAYAQNINFAVSAEEILALYSDWDGTERELSSAGSTGTSSVPAANEESGTGNETTMDVFLLAALKDETAASCFSSAQNRCFFAALSIVDWNLKGNDDDLYTSDFLEQVYVGKMDDVLGVAFPVRENSSSRLEYIVFLHILGEDNAIFSIVNMDKDQIKIVMDAVFSDGTYAVPTSDLLDSLNQILDTVNEHL